MRAILIDPATQTVMEHDFSAEFKDLAPLLGCEWVAPVRLDGQRELVYVDDEGMIQETQRRHFFHIAGYPGPLCGRALLIGPEDSPADDAPAFTPAKVGLVTAMRMVTWITEGEAMLILRTNQRQFIESAEAAGFVCERIDEFAVLATR